MQNMSRKAKYKKLRQELQMDAEAQISTKGLSEYTERLSRLDQTAAEQIDVQQEENHDPAHLRRESYFVQKTAEKKPQDSSTATFNNEYLDEYISEVKEYNKQRGLLSSEDTQVNILKQLRESSSVRPFEEKMVSTSKDNLLDDMDIPAFVQSDETLRNTISMEVRQLLDQSAATAEAPQEEETQPQQEEQEEPKEEKKPRWKLFGKRSEDDEDDEEEDEDLDEEEEEDWDEEDDQTRPHRLFGRLRSHMKEERELREKLMNETVQLRVQMDEYENELNDMNDSVSYTNRMLNFILVLLILALLVVLGIVVYWILLEKGMIG